MCLATPMRIEKIVEGQRAIVSQGKVTVEVNVSLLHDPRPGDHVIVHAGFAIEILDEDEAKETLRLFQEIEDAYKGSGKSG